MRVRLLLMAVAAEVAILVFATCSYPPSRPATGISGLPDYAYRSASAMKGYQIALEERDLLAQLPCYCGCGQDPQYRSLADCFFENDQDFRPHAASCQICLDEADDAARWKSMGLSARGIRDRIESDYEGRGQPTDTPPIEDRSLEDERWAAVAGGVGILRFSAAAKPCLMVASRRSRTFQAEAEPTTGTVKVAPPGATLPRLLSEEET